MELVETYSLWDAMNKNGDTITIDPEALKDVQAQKDNEAKKAKSSMYSSKITASAANIKSETTDLRRDAGYNVKYKYQTYDRSTGKSYTTTGFRQFTEEEVNQVTAAFNELQNAGELETAALKESLIQHGSLSQELIDNIDVIAENQAAFAHLAESIETAANANETYAKEILNYAADDTQEEKDELMRIANGDEEIYEQIKNAQAARFATDLTNSEGKTLQEATEDIDVSGVKSNNSLEAVATNASHLDDSVKNDFKDMDDEQTARMYAKYVLDRDDYDELTYEGGSGKGTLKTVDGNEKIIDAGNDEDMRQALARYLKMLNLMLKQMKQVVILMPRWKNWLILVNWAKILLLLYKMVLKMQIFQRYKV